MGLGIGLGVAGLAGFAVMTVFVIRMKKREKKAKKEKKTLEMDGVKKTIDKSDPDLEKQKYTSITTDKNTLPNITGGSSNSGNYKELPNLNLHSESSPGKINNPIFSCR